MSSIPEQIGALDEAIRHYADEAQHAVTTLARKHARKLIQKLKDAREAIRAMGDEG